MYNILVCDDEKDIVTALSIYLSSEGYQVYEAYNGREALDILEREEIHLVIECCMSFALWWKLGKWWRHTLIFLLGTYCWKGCRAFGRFCIRVWSYFAQLVRSIRFLWKARSIRLKCFGNLSGTEGNGLGLSIARSLTELMGGSLELIVDGDLFKVVLSFPICQGRTVMGLEEK